MRFGWHVGFLAAAVGMALGMLAFVTTRHWLSDIGAPPAAPPGRRRRDLAILTAAALTLWVGGVLLWTGTLAVRPDVLLDRATLVMLAMVGAYALWLLTGAGLTRQERRGVSVLLVLVAASTLFWAGYEQAGSSLTLFAQRHTASFVGGFEVPAAWFQAVPAAFVLTLAPILAWVWVTLDTKHRNPSVIFKFALGLAGMALGFLVMVGAAEAVGPSLVEGSGGASPLWLVLTYLLHTLGELCLSPVGLSATTRLTPRRYAGQAMGLWFTSIAMGNLLAGKLAASSDGADARHLADDFFLMFVYGAAGVAALLLAWPLLRRWATPER